MVTQFNPYLREKLGNVSKETRIAMETPLFLFDVKDDWNTTLLRSTLDPGTPPHVFQLQFKHIDKTATKIKTHETGKINVDVFSVEDIDRHTYKLSLPPDSGFMVAVDIFGVPSPTLNVRILLRFGCSIAYQGIWSPFLP